MTPNRAVNAIVLISRRSQGRRLVVRLTELATNPVFSTRDFKAVPEKYRVLDPEYVKDYVSLNQFAA